MTLIYRFMALVVLSCSTVSLKAEPILGGTVSLTEVFNTGQIGGDLGLVPNLDVTLGALGSLLDPNALQLESLVSNILLNSLQGNTPRLTADVLSGALLVSVIESNLNGNLILVSTLPGLAK